MSVGWWGKITVTCSTVVFGLDWLGLHTSLASSAVNVTVTRLHISGLGRSPMYQGIGIEVETHAVITGRQCYLGRQEPDM